MSGYVPFDSDGVPILIGDIVIDPHTSEFGEVHSIDIHIKTGRADTIVNYSITDDKSFGGTIVHKSSARLKHYRPTAKELAIEYGHKFRWQCKIDDDWQTDEERHKKNLDRLATEFVGAITETMEEK